MKTETPFFQAVKTFNEQNLAYEVQPEIYHEFFNLIEQSRIGHEKDVRSQEKVLKTLVYQLPKELYLKVERVFRAIRAYLNCSTEFQQLHWSRGGIVDSGDDGFYIDFMCWLIGQGEELLNQLETEGASAVLNYIRDHQIPESEYMWECLGYAFHRYMDEIVEVNHQEIMKSCS